uniref:Uncharacterized protein n=1 Tax=Caenorhabditis japonica TaxID=281687 RepID=A0A8R1EPN9_CAEJA
MRNLIISLLIFGTAVALLPYPSPTFSTDRIEGHPLRSKRYLLITQHARQVQEEFEVYQRHLGELQKAIEDQEERSLMKIGANIVVHEGKGTISGKLMGCTEPVRVKREWFATMSPEELRDRMTLYDMSIKKKHH